MARFSRPLPSVTGPGRRARWRRAVLRRLLSAALAAGAVVVATTVARPSPPPTVTVVVAAHRVPSGAVLTAADLRSTRVRDDAAQPAALTSVADAVGRRLAASLASGEALTAGRLVPRGPADGLPTGRVALHVVAADPASVDLLSPGVGARVYPVAGGPPLAVAAEVLAADPPSAVSDPLVTGDVPGRGVVLSLSVAEADAVLQGHGALDGPATVSLIATP
ncbi:MAG TPA: SAF domain-containing protein [Ornithinibacter sp.]|nr:SAF domain-containing protein [Ornithinibacter sp.]